MNRLVRNISAISKWMVALISSEDIPWNLTLPVEKAPSKTLVVCKILQKS
jgi:hypothetical protein